METWRKIEEKLQVGEGPSLNFHPLVWEKLIEMEERLEQLEKRIEET